MGYSVTAYAAVIDNPVKSLELLNDFSITKCKESDGYWRSYYDSTLHRDVKTYIYNYDEISKAKIKINYSDGTYKYTRPYEYIDGYQVGVKSDQETDPWYFYSNDNHLTITYLKKEVSVPVTVLPNNVESLELVKASERTFIENDEGRMIISYDPETGEELDSKYFYYDAYGFEDAVVKINYIDGTSTTADECKDMALNICYEDGSKELINIESVAYEKDDPDSEFKTVIAYTEKGLVNMRFAKPGFRDDLDYDLFVFGIPVDIDKEYLFGDVNGDGDVDVNDASLVNRFSAQYKIGSADYLTSCGDIDGDGIISVSDSTWLQRYIAGMEIPFEIGERIDELS